MNEKTLQADYWVSKYADMLYAYTVVRVNDTNVAEDIVQETFLGAWKGRETYNGDASEKNWLFTICKNKIIDYFRKKGNNLVSYGELDTNSGVFDDQDHWTNESAPKNWKTNDMQPVERKEFYSILEMCKQKLQQLQQQVFVMKYMEDIDSDEICKVLNITPSNYWVLIHRAKIQLRKCMEFNWMKIA